MARFKRAGLAAAATALAYAALSATATAQAPRTPAPVDYAAGRRLVEWKCNACHRSVRATESRKTRAASEATVARMVGNGLDAKDEEIEAIIQYLVSLNASEDAP